jgi:hypothetical protein
VVALAVLMVLSIIGLIAAAVGGVDAGVLRDMSRPEYARGLITFLFAVVTIGSALLLIVSGLIGPGDDVSERKFQRGKEVLSLLLGVFGTIVGYYFGSSHTGGTPALRVSAIETLPSLTAAGTVITARALVAGGSPPYRYVITLDGGMGKEPQHVSENGVISERVTLGNSSPNKTHSIHLTVEDAIGQKTEAATTIEVPLK